MSEPTSLSETMLTAIEVDLQIATDAFDPRMHRDLYEMVAYHLGWKGTDGAARGKRVRPLLTLLACAAAGGRWQAALPAATAVELIHNFSLVHDDIEDRSPTRRGRPTIWTRWGVPQAINTGDALLTLAHLETIRLSAAGVPTDTLLDVQKTLDQACLDLTRGQHLDIAFETREQVTAEEYLAMIEGKTAALLSAATWAGARIANAPREKLLSYQVFGRHLGLAFQILDDLLGIWGEPEATGKSAGDDLRSRKKTLPALLGLERSEAFRRLWSGRGTDDQAMAAMRAALDEAGAAHLAQGQASEHTDLALAALRQAGGSSPAAEELESLASRLLRRER
jgi:geranylgeranyl diphosphate synthase type I